MRMRFSILVLFLAIQSSGQNFTTVTAANVHDAEGHKLTAGEICFEPVAADGSLLSVRPLAGKSPARIPACAPVTNGVMRTLQVANPATTLPTRIFYRVTVKNSATRQAWVAVPRVTWLGTVFNLDEAAQNASALPLGDGTSRAALANSVNGIRYPDQFPGPSVTAKLDAAIADIGNNPGLVIATPALGGGAWSFLPNNVALLDYRQTQEFITGFSSTDADRPALMLLEDRQGEMTARPLAGTVTLSNGSTTVTGMGTSFISQLSDHYGRSLRLNGDDPATWARIISVADDTHATLAVRYTGKGGSGPASYLVEHVGFAVRNWATAGIPNTASAGDSVGISAIANRIGGGRPLWAGNFSSTYYNQLNKVHGIEIDMSNLSGVDWPLTGAIENSGFDDLTGQYSSGMVIGGAGSHRNGYAIQIDSASAASQFQAGIYMAGWNQYGVRSYATNPSGVHAAYYLHSVNNNPTIWARSGGDAATQWRLNNDGSAAFAAAVTATQLVSNVGNGTPPLVVHSSTNVPNLNASTLNGATHASPGPIGSTTPSTGAFTSLVIDGDGPVSAAPRMVWSAYIPAPFSQSRAGWSFYFAEKPVTVTRITAVLTGALPAGCRVQPKIRVSDGATNTDLSMPNGKASVDSGVLNQNYPAVRLQIGTVAGVGCTTDGQNPNVTVNYKMQ